jgi:iron complex outermembrane recepter protein
MLRQTQSGNSAILKSNLFQLRMRLHFKHNILFALLSFAASVYSQKCNLSLSGKIIDLDDSGPMSFATIIIEEKKIALQADSLGRFKIDSLCPGDYLLNIKHFDCPDTVVGVRITESRKIEIKLPHTAVRLEGVDVYGESITPKTTQTSNSLSGEELDKTRGKNLGDAMEDVSGITNLKTGGTISKPMIHGLQGYRILILNNGIRQEGQNWGNEHAPEIDPFIAKKITVVKGASAVRYGSDAIAGVILVEPGDLPDSAGINGEFNLVGMSNGQTGVTSGMLEGNIDKLKGLNWRVQGTVKRGGNIKTPGYYLASTALEEKNFSYAIGYHKKRWGTEIFYSQFNTRIGIFSGSHTGNLTDLQNAFEGNVNYDTTQFTYVIGRPSQKVGHELIKGNLHFHTGKRSRINFNYSYQYNIRQEYDKHKALNDSLAALDLPDLDYRIETQTGEIVWDHDYIRAFRGMAGVSYMHQENAYRGRFFIPNFINDTWGIFGIERYIRPKYEIELGARYDEKYLQVYMYENNTVINPSLHFSNLSANAGFIFKADSALNFFLNTGSAWRSPAVNELFSDGLHHGAAAIEHGDKNLVPERAINTILSVVFKKSKWKLEAAGYFNYIRNFIFQEPGAVPELTIKGAFPVFYFRQANVGIYGGDLLLKYSLSKWVSFETKGMLIYGYNYSAASHLVYIPAHRVKEKVEVKLKDRKKWKSNFIAVIANYVNKQWRVPAGIDFAPPPPAYLLLDVEMGTTVKLAKQEFGLGFSANNLLNTKYRDYLDRFRYFADAQGRNFTLRIKYLFSRKSNSIKN